MKVELKGQFNTSVGTVLTIKTTNKISVGDKISVEGKEYVIKGLMHPTGAFDMDIVSVIV